MKTAVSVPEEVYAEAERLARRLQITVDRSVIHERAGVLDSRQLALVLSGIDVVLGR